MTGRFVSCVGVWVIMAGVAAHAQPLPPDAGVINVRDHGAVGDGVTDDTAALQAAVRAVLDRENRYASPPMLYLPEGTYLVSDTIEGKAAEHGWSGGWRAGLIIRGASRDRTIIKLQDRLPAFGDANAPRPVLITGSESDTRTKPGDAPLDGGGNRAFRHSVLHLTLDVGAGNPGAVGIDYMAHNRGTIDTVTLRSSDPAGAGHTGLKMTRKWPGPCLITDVVIEGFGRGIDVAHYEYGNVFENITLRRQAEAGIVVKQNMVAIHRLDSDNAVPVIRTDDNNALVVVVGGKWTRAAGGSAATAAVTGSGELYLRDITVEGYGKAVATTRKGAKDLDLSGGGIDLYKTERFALGADEARPLALPIKPTPRYASEDFTQWVSPQQFVPMAGEGAPSPAEGDWTDALQAALDSGKPVVYLPNGSYRVSRTLTVPPHVRLIVGYQSAITPGKDREDEVDPLLRFVGAGGDATTVEHVWISGHVEHAATRAVAFRHCDLHGRYTNTPAGTGDLFIEDTIGPKPLLVAHPQNVFARQLNIEFGDKPLIENHGGTLWLLGYKTEGQMVCLRQTAGRAELLGGLLYPLRKVEGGTPAFLIEGGEAALSFAMSGPRYPTVIRSRVRTGEQSLSLDAVGGRAVALATVVAGADVEAKGGVVERDATDDEAVPFWNGRAADEGGAYVDPRGDRWSVLAVGGTGGLERSEPWQPLRWNAASSRWEAPAMQDQAPSYDRNRRLRGRPSDGKLVGLAFAPKIAGTFALEGQAKAETWGPDGPVNIMVLVAGPQQARTLLQLTVPDNAVVNWAEHDALQRIELGGDERLVITFASEKGGTANLHLAATDRPTTIKAR